MGSELWFREFERLLNAKLAAGIDEDKAYDEAGEEAGPAVAESLADAADFERKRRREEGK